MLQFHILTGSKAGQVIHCKETPATIGRGSLVHVSLPDPGVWDEHLALEFQGVEIQAKILGSGLASINGNPFMTSLVKNGDLISIGAASFRVYLEPAEQKSLRSRELATWLGVAAIVILQITIIFMLAL